jgi:hypothetical protein
MKTSARLAALFTRADLRGAVAAVTPERIIEFYITIEGIKEKSFGKNKKRNWGRLERLTQQRRNWIRHRATQPCWEGSDALPLRPRASPTTYIPQSPYSPCTQMAPGCPQASHRCAWACLVPVEQHWRQVWPCKLGPKLMCAGGQPDLKILVH